MVTLGNIVYCVSLPENLNALNIRIRVDLQKNNLFVANYKSQGHLSHASDWQNQR